MRVLVDNDSRWSLQILLNEDITDAASAIRNYMHHAVKTMVATADQLTIVKC